MSDNKKDLAIARGVKLPADAVTQTFGLLGRKGSGKTYASGKLVELLLEAGAQVVVLDPVGNWYGLRLSADGRANGFAIPVFGGEHGDIPLEHTGGALIADTVVSHHTSAVIDVSHFRKGQRKEFVAHFAEQLFHLKKSDRTPVFLVLEEAQVFAPQRAGKGEERMLGAIEDIVRLGRNYGIGAALISQRPQSVNKEVLNQVEALFVFQTSGPQERKAIESWVIEKGIDIKEMVDQLPSLETGTAFLWSPQWLRILQKVHINKKKTFDASSTPTLGGRVVKPKKLTPVDLEQLQDAMKETIERKQADDPKRLHQEITRLNAQVKRLTQEKEQAKDDRPLITDKQIEELKTVYNDLKNMRTDLSLIRAEISQNTHDILAYVELATGKIEDFEKLFQQLKTGIVRPQRQQIRQQPVQINKPTPKNGEREPISRLSPMHKAILTTLAQHGACRKNRLVLLAGYTWNGSVRNALSSLRTAGLIVGQNTGEMDITQDGLNLIMPFDPLPVGEDLRQFWLNKFGPMAQAVLQSLFDNPNGLNKDELVETAGYTWNGSMRNTLSQLRTAGVITGKNTEIMRASDYLMG